MEIIEIDVNEEAKLITRSTEIAHFFCLDVIKKPLVQQL